MRRKLSAGKWRRGSSAPLEFKLRQPAGTAQIPTLLLPQSFGNGGFDGVPMQILGDNFSVRAEKHTTLEIKITFTGISRQTQAYAQRGLQIPRHVSQMRLRPWKFHVGDTSKNGVT